MAGTNLGGWPGQAKLARQESRVGCLPGKATCEFPGTWTGQADQTSGSVMGAGWLDLGSSIHYKQVTGVVVAGVWQYHFVVAMTGSLQYIIYCTTIGSL